jgi:hypothetical protein
MPQLKYHAHHRPTWHYRQMNQNQELHCALCLILAKRPILQVRVLTIIRHCEKYTRIQTPAFSTNLILRGYINGFV